MTIAQRATADVFLTALKALPKAERDAVVVRIAGLTTAGSFSLFTCLGNGRDRS